MNSVQVRGLKDLGTRHVVNPEVELWDFDFTEIHFSPTPVLDLGGQKQAAARKYVGDRGDLLSVFFDGRTGPAQMRAIAEAIDEFLEAHPETKSRTEKRHG